MRTHGSWPLCICEGYLPRYRVWQERPEHGIAVGVGFLLGVQYCHLGVKLVNKRDFGDNRYGYGMFCAPLSITTKSPRCRTSLPAVGALLI